MGMEIRVPSVGESITEVQVAKWLKQEGQWVDQDEPVVELETEKTTLEVPAPSPGFLGPIQVPQGQFTQVDAVLAVIEPGERPADAPPAATLSSPQPVEPPVGSPEKAPPHPGATPREVPAGRREELEERFEALKEPRPEPPQRRKQSPPDMSQVMPSARRLMHEKNLSPQQLKGSGPGGRILKEDVINAVADETPAEEPQPVPEAASLASQPPAELHDYDENMEANRGEEVVPMSPMRLRIAQRLVEAQQTAALLTTFNEIDMTEVIRLRKEYQEKFQKEYGTKLGFMSFFVKATVEALKRFPQVNAEIRGRQIVYHNFFDIGIAIGSGKGLVVPVLRNAESLSLAEIEKEIGEMARRVQEKKLTPEELEGGTFTITNGGIYGSLLSTPIINPPQSGILGMHKIQERPVVKDGQIVARSMMYVALTYDHRLVDGREAVSFLHHIKDVIEEPSRILLEV